MEKEWIKNTGKVPEQLKENPDRTFEVRYCGGFTLPLRNTSRYWVDNECLWHIIGDTNDVECWRFVDE